MKTILMIIFLVSMIFAHSPHQDTVDVVYGRSLIFVDTKNPQSQIGNNWYIDGSRGYGWYGSSWYMLRDQGIVLTLPASFYDGSYHVLEAKDGTTGTDRWILHAVQYVSIEKSQINVNKPNTAIRRYDVLGRRIYNNSCNNRIITKNGIKIILK